MKALFIQHDHVSPTGPVAERLRQHGFEIEERLVVSQDDFGSPNVNYEFPDFSDYDLIIPMGAPWGAWDEACIGNWLLPEIEWIRQAVTSGKPVLGICFGGQLIARAMGGSVAPGAKGEIGWTYIFSDRPDLVSNGPWFQFHYDRWQLPGSALEVARNSAASQAFTNARNLGVQFHPELTVEMLSGWLNNGGRDLVIKDGQDPDVLLAHTAAEQVNAKERTNQLVDAFLRDIAKLI
jgi:GMP synthase-like glutamine amidotransferase